ncbi:protein kinase [Pseudomonas helleri]|uniref:protein kinase n=1 Tax=Pseudomonas helleri TaxID=1608996 RepID=UPI0012971053|nr:protein kinase [Pseudomonas helleri]MQT30667.1 protein kinase [Pseudomonas helleri]
MYNPKSCNALEKPFYTPIEAALRWCNLIAHEVAILTSAGDEIVPSISAFPQWPCLRANTEKLVDAMYNGDLQYGRDGRTVCPGEQVAKHRRTVRHADLKAWMAMHYPDQKPAFLFDEIERTTHAAVTVEAIQALQADRDALKVRLENAEAWWEQEGKGLKAERDQWRSKYDQVIASDLIESRERVTIERLIYVLAKEAKYRLDKLSSDEDAIQVFASSIGALVPTGKGTIAKQLKAACNRAAEDKRIMASERQGKQ